MKVTEYEGHKVPEGATHYTSESRFQRAGFYKHNKIRPFFYSVNLFKEWVESINKEIPSFAIKLPEQQEDNAEWVPAGRCVHIYGGGVATRQEEDVNIVGIDKEGFYVFQNDKSTCYYSGPASEFRPLKTDEQKAKEAFDLKAFKVYKSCMSCNEFSTALFKAGFTAPEGEL